MDLHGWMMLRKNAHRIFGNLEKDNWYKFTHLNNLILITFMYILIVQIKVHRFDMNLANY